KVVDTLMAHPKVGKLLKKGQAEQSWFAKHATGIWIKSRPDFFNTDGVIIDVKTVGSCETDFLKRRVFDGGSYQQAPWYCDVAERVLGAPATDYFWICVEQK